MKKILKEKFGFNNFKPIQEKAIKEILEKKDLLVVLPTGSGKSLIYQLSTLLMDGVTIVISPLIALMQDQVSSLQINNIKAKMISSNNTNEENDKTISELLDNKLKLLYVAPERFTNSYFLNILQKININFFVIDEAHCVSEWGHEFRNDYRKLKNLKKWFKNTPITAFTATATKEVQEDILKTLQIDKNQVLRAKIVRDNLIIKAKRKKGNAKEQIVEFLNQHKNECGIVYCFSRKETEKLSLFLNSIGFESEAYHAGLNPKKRDKIFKAFKNEEIKIIVATIAFGMGIDKSNIRFVLHTSMPKTLENYFQEIGRAGRDGLMSDTLLLYSKADEISKRAFIDELPDSIYKQNMYEKMNKMYRYAISSKCRHQLIAKYFGDEIEKCEKLCDNCLEKDTPYKDVTIEAQKFLSTIIRTKERFGANYIIDVLRGSKAKRIMDFSHDKLSVYGIGKELNKEQWNILFEKLLDEDALIIDKEFGSLKITNIGKKILKKELNIQIKAQELENEKKIKKDISLAEENPKNKIFEKLKELRLELAKQEDVPAYIIFSDKTLMEISKFLPTTKEEFLQIPGVGEVKLEKYSDPFLEVCKNFKQQKKEKISKTYQETLSLINKGDDFQTICKKRNFNEITILHHLEKLHELNYIDTKTKEVLVSTLKNNFPKEIKKWIEDGLKKFDFDELRKNISIYKYIY